MTKKIYIDQSLHGYSNGHKLLNSSIQLSNNDSRKMTILSDLSGNEFVNGFQNYYTGYKLSNGKIILACTWYADEMSRPGCVWTHSLIIDESVMKNSSNFAGSICSLFRKPQSIDDFLLYDKQLEIQGEFNLLINDNKLKYTIWCLWGNKSPLVIFADNSIEYENEILYIFLTQNEVLDTNFSFCTGSVSLRTYGNQIMQLQIVPYKLSRSGLSVGDKVVEAKEEGLIKNFPMWVNKVYENLMKDNLYDFKSFRDGFSKQYKHATYFSAFIKLYVGSEANQRNLNLATLLQMACAIFDDKKNICKEILNLYYKNYFLKWMGQEDYIRTLEFLINNCWIEMSIKNISELVNNGLCSNYLESKKIFKNIISIEENYIVEQTLNTYAYAVTEENFVNFTDLEYDLCSTLITLNPKHALNKQLWKQKKGYQQGIITCLDLERTDEKLIGQIIETILEFSEYDLSFNLYKIYNDKSIKWYWKYILINTEGIKAQGIKKIIRKDVINCIQVLKEKINNRDSLLLIIEILDSYDLEIRRISKEELSSLFSTIKNKDCTEKQDEIIAKFLIPFCLIPDYKAPLDIAKFSFEIVHKLLGMQAFPENEWEKLDKLLPQVAWYNNWDRCKRLRKGFKKKGYSIKEILDSDDLPIHLL